MRTEKSALKKRDIETVTIIGSGFSGLVSALLLARAGLNVILLERQHTTAPLLRNYTIHSMEINHGFHYIGGYYPNSALYKCFDHLGISQKLTPISYNNHGYDVFSGILENNKDITLPVGSTTVKETLKKDFPDCHPILDLYFNLLDEVFSEFSFFDIENYFYKKTPSLTGLSLLEFLHQHHASKPFIAFLDAYSQMLMGLRADEISLLSHLLGVGAYFLSAQTFRGGGGALIKALEEEVIQAGVQILTNHEVTQIHYEARRVFSGLRARNLDTATEVDIPADACISTIHPKRLLPLLKGGSAADIYARRIADFVDTRAVCLFHLAVKKEIIQRFSSNFHRFYYDEQGELQHQITLLPDFAEQASASADEGLVTIMTTAWLNDTHCPIQHQGQCGSAQLLPATHFGPVKANYLENYRLHMQQELEKAFPEFKGNYRIINAVSPCHFERLNATWDGSIYGVKCSINRLGMSTIGPVKGLLLAGQSITAPGIYGTLVSAYLACNRITGNIKP